MTTTADVIARCRNDYLMTGQRDQRNVLAADITSGADSLSCTYDLRGIKEGSKLSINLEDMHVWATTDSAKTATVQRAEFGSTAATHTAGAVILVNPIVTDAQILREVNNELGALSSPANGLFQMNTVDLTYNASVEGYDLTSVGNVISIWELRYHANGSWMDWPVVDASEWNFQQSLDTGQFASGKAVFVRGAVDPGRTLRVWYRAPYTALTTVTDNVTTIAGLHAEAHDLLALGAAIRLTAGREIKRNFTETQGDTRRAAEVPPGANLGSNRALAGLRAQRIAEERSRLAAMFPQRLR